MKKRILLLILTSVYLLTAPKSALATAGQACCKRVPTSLFASVPTGSNGCMPEWCLPGAFCDVNGKDPLCDGLCALAKTTPDTCENGKEYCDLGTKTCKGLAPPPNPSCKTSGGNNGVNTAVGCISTDPSEFIKQILTVAVSIGSGLAFLLIIYASYKILTSQGNPEGINQGKETLTAAIIGLIFIVLSVTIMQVIGYDILGLGSLGLSGTP